MGVESFEKRYFRRKESDRPKESEEDILRKAQMKGEKGKGEIQKEKPEIDPDILRYFQVLSEREMKKAIAEQKLKGETHFRMPPEKSILMQLEEGSVLEAFDYLGGKAREFQQRGDEKGVGYLRELQRKFPMAEVRREREERRKMEEEMKAVAAERELKEKEEERKRILEEAERLKEELEKRRKGEYVEPPKLVRLTPEQQKIAEEEYKKIEQAREEVGKTFEEKPEEREKREIKLIEEMPMYSDSRMNMVLLYEGVKPAAFVSSFWEIEKGKKENALLNQAAEGKGRIQKTLDKLGFIYQIKEEIIPTKEKNRYDLAYKVFTSRNPDNLKRLLEAYEKGDEKEIGLALGYPETAAEAFPDQFLNYKKLRKELPKDEKEDLLQEGVFKFLDFVPSEDHWREELERGRESQALIKEKAPDLYQEIIESKDPILE